VHWRRQLIAVCAFWFHLPTTEQIFRIQHGMSQSEVEAIAGKPQERTTNFSDGEYWAYWTDILGVFSPEMVEFDSSGHVVRTWSH
jgi:hypothetical protein